MFLSIIYFREYIKIPIDNACLIWVKSKIKNDVQKKIKTDKAKLGEILWKKTIFGKIVKKSIDKMTKLNPRPILNAI